MDKDKLNNLADKFKKHLQNMTPEQKAEMEEHFRDKTPKGWVSIEEHLPQCTVEDFCDKGYSVYKVKDKDGKEFDSAVCDHDMWYYEAKAIGITHWWNGEQTARTTSLIAYFNPTFVLVINHS